MDNQTELAWAAGFFDGEGCTSLETKSASLKVTITQQHPEVLERFISAVGVGKVYGPYYYGPKKKARWAINIQSKAAIVALAKIWPYLGSEKKNQALRSLEELSLRLKNNKYPSLGNSKK
jgi:hypothetical protein